MSNEAERTRGTEGTEAGGESELDGFDALAARLRSIAERAPSERWAGWTEEDRRAVLTAAREIEGIRAALAEGMRQAFDIGCEYGQGQELLDRLNLEIEDLSGRMARQAWGGGDRPDGAADA